MELSLHLQVQTTFLSEPLFLDLSVQNSKNEVF